MPVWLRSYTFRKMEEHYEKEKEQAEEMQNRTKNTGTPVKGPNIKAPSYSTKARK